MAPERGLAGPGEAAEAYVTGYFRQKGWAAELIGGSYPYIDIQVTIRSGKGMAPTFKAQVKRRKALRRRQGGITCDDVPVEHLKIWLARSEPHVLVGVDPDWQAYWLPIDGELEKRLDREGLGWREGESVSIRLPAENLFDRDNLDSLDRLEKEVSRLTGEKRLHKPNFDVLLEYDSGSLRLALGARPPEFLSRRVPRAELEALRSHRGNLLLRGKPGSGKTTTLFEIVDSQHPAPLVIAGPRFRRTTSRGWPSWAWRNSRSFAMTSTNGRMRSIYSAGTYFPGTSESLPPGGLRRLRRSRSGTASSRQRFGKTGGSGTRRSAT